MQIKLLRLLLQLPWDNALMQSSGTCRLTRIAQLNFNVRSIGWLISGDIDQWSFCCLKSWLYDQIRYWSLVILNSFQSTHSKAENCQQFGDATFLCVFLKRQFRTRYINIHEVLTHWSYSSPALSHQYEAFGGFLSRVYPCGLQGFFSSTIALTRLPHCQWSDPEGYGYIFNIKPSIKKYEKIRLVCLNTCGALQR